MLTPYASAPLAVYQPPLYNPYANEGSAPLNGANLWPMANGKSIHPGEQLYDKIERQGLLNFIFESNEYQPLSYYLKQAALGPVNMAKRTLEYATGYFQNIVRSLDKPEPMEEKAKKEEEFSLEACKVQNSSVISVINVATKMPVPGTARLVSWKITVKKYSPMYGLSITDKAICQKFKTVLNGLLKNSNVNFLFTTTQCCRKVFPLSPGNYKERTLQVAGDYSFSSFNYSVKVEFNFNETLNYMVYGRQNLSDMYNNFLWNEDFFQYWDEYSGYSGNLTSVLSFCISNTYYQKNKLMLKIVIASPILYLIALTGFVYRFKDDIKANYQRYLNREGDVKSLNDVKMAQDIEMVEVVIENSTETTPLLDE